MATDLELAVMTLIVKKEKYDKYFAYYEGDQPLIYTKKRLEEIFDKLDARFTQNWCAVVVDSVLERIQLRHMTVADNEAMSERLGELLMSSELMLESDDVHLAAVVTGEAYIIAWKDEGADPEAYYNDPRNVHMFYDASKPRTKRFACKWWLGDDGHRYLTLYYPDRLEYYRTDKQVVTEDTVAEGFVSAESYYKAFEPYGGAEGSVVENPYGQIPVFHFRRVRRKISSELANIIEPQDAVNKLLADMMIASEFGAFPQRYTISSTDPGTLQNAPNKIWNIPANEVEGGQATSVGQFPATELANYTLVVDKWTTSIGVISRVPKHFFYSQGGDPSGEALIAMEAPLNKKSQKYIDRFSSTWSELACFMLLLDGVVVEDDAVIPHFDTPETVQPLTAALIRESAIKSGIPLMWQLRQEGYTDEELAQLEDDQATAQAQQRATLAQAMTDAERNFDQGGEE